MQERMPNILLRVLRRFSNFLRQRTPACAGIRRHAPIRDCWRSRDQIFGGLKTPAPFSVESFSVAYQGGSSHFFGIGIYPVSDWFGIGIFGQYCSPLFQIVPPFFP
jgi:hypothetical protein